MHELKRMRPSLVMGSPLYRNKRGFPGCDLLPEESKRNQLGTA